MDQLPAEHLSPLSARVDEVLSRFGYALAPAIEAIDDAVPGYGGLFDPGTTDSERRAALADVLAADTTQSLSHISADRVVLYVDGSSRGNPGPAGAGAVLCAEGNEVALLGRPVGSHTDNNVAEYAALHLGLTAVATVADPGELAVRIDSMTVVNSVWGDAVPESAAATYAAGIEEHLSALPQTEWTHLADSDPNPADSRATVGADIAALGPG